LLPCAADTFDSLNTPDDESKEEEDDEDDDEKEDDEEEDDGKEDNEEEEEEENVRGLPARTTIAPGHVGEGNGTCSSDLRSFASLPSLSAHDRNSRKIENSMRLAIKEPTL